ncbi:hypothetical protein [Motilimonas pumila]|uniref:Uncharacterized protein n=1 Tax=Motilimonas pumila TaxID=2303987 RepID=A0A418YDE4_9GAMM|nr:hypothetical protein [Motilimonas pumila]RJG42566.1 hypothetical protein D1Z90_12955 [Motilimonas pumila]
MKLVLSYFIRSLITCCVLLSVCFTHAHWLEARSLSDLIFWYGLVGFVVGMLLIQSYFAGEDEDKLIQEWLKPSRANTNPSGFGAVKMGLPFVVSSLGLIAYAIYI